jgi:acetyl esterase/lipase
LADGASVLILSVEYRLAPEHPYPAAVNDCVDVARWLAENSRHEFGTERLFIGGESAGAHLAVLTLLRMRDEHAFTGFSGAHLLYGCFDLSGTDSLLAWGDSNLILDTPTMQWFFDQFVPDAERSDPRISPLYADLTSMPPALFIVGTLDPLLDDTLLMAARWQAAGSLAELMVYPGGVHAFNAFPLEITRDANQLSQTFFNCTG